MRPAIPPQLIARLGGLALIGFSIPWVVMPMLAIVSSLRGPPRGSTSGVLLGTVQVTMAEITSAGIVEYLVDHGMSVVGLLIGTYWLFVGCWPIRWAVSREYSRG